MKQKRKRSYAWAVLGLLLTITVAIFLPQVIFMIQDYRQTSTVDVTTRETYDVLSIETVYLQDVNARMYRMAGIRYKEMTISKIARTMDVNDCMNMLSDVKGQYYMEYLMDMLPTTCGEIIPYLSVTQLETCDCYMVHGNDYTDGVILMFWYMVFDIPELDAKVELIVDSETETIYYVRVLENLNSGNLVGIAGNDVIISGDYYYGQTILEGVDSRSLLPDIDHEVESVANNFAGYFDYYVRYYGIYHSETFYNGNKDKITVLNVDSYAYENCVIGEDMYTMAYALPYGNSIDSTLFFRFCVTKSEEYGTDISIGIPIIRQFVQP